MASLPGLSRHLPQLPRFEKKVGIVGIGRMGSNIAERLYHARVPVSVIYDSRMGAARDVAREFRCTHAQTLAEVNASCEIVITSVTDDDAVDAVFSENGDSLLLGAANQTFIECSSVSPTLHVAVSRRLQDRRAKFVEACLSGSSLQAHDGTLYMIVAGEKLLIDSLAPLLRLLSRTQVFVGEIGRAAEIETLINMVTNAHTAALAEAMALGSALGVNLDQLREIFGRTSASSRVLLSDGEQMQRREHTTLYTADQAAKDLGIALTLAKAQGLDLPVAVATQRQYQMMRDVGLGYMDKSGISELTFADRRRKWREIAEAAQKSAVGGAPKA